MSDSSSFFHLDSGAPQRRETSLPLLLSLVVLCTLPMIVLSQLAAHWRFDVVDDQMFGYFGWRIAGGATVYLDVWDNKPPGIYWINAVGHLLGGGYGGVIALCALALVLSHVLFFAIAASIYFRGTAALLTVLASFFITHIFYQGGANRTETFLVLFELGGMALYLRGWARDRWWAWLGAGACCGCAFLFKQVGLAAIGAMALHTLAMMITREAGVLAGARRGATILCGFAIPLTCAVGYLASQDALQAAWFATFEFNRAYFSAGDSSLFDNWFNRYMLQSHMLPILRLPILMALASALHAVAWWLKPKFRPADVHEPIRRFGATCPNPVLLFGLWTLLALWGASVSPHYFRHYLIPFIPPLMLVSGHILNVIKTEAGLLERIAQRGWVAAAFVAMGWFAFDAFWRQWEETAKVLHDRFPSLSLVRAPADGSLPSNVGVFAGYQYRKTTWEQVGEEVARLSRSNQRIHCWGYMPGVYLSTHRINACRFITTEKIGHVGDRADFVRQELHRVFTESPPTLFVAGAQDYFWFMGASLAKRDWLGAWMGTWLPQNYALMRDLTTPDGVVFIFKRRDQLEPGETPLSPPVLPPVGDR